MVGQNCAPIKLWKTDSPFLEIFYDNLHCLVYFLTCGTFCVTLRSQNIKKTYLRNPALIKKQIPDPENLERVREPK